MAWEFDVAAGPFEGALGGLAWDGQGMLFSAVGESRILRYRAETGSVEEVRKYTNGTTGIGLSPEGELFGCQSPSRRVIRFLRDGSAALTATLLDGRYHNQPSDLFIDGRNRIWFTDPFADQPSSGPPLFPPLEHASVLRLDRDTRGLWSIRRMTQDTSEPRAVLLSPDGTAVYVAESNRRPERVRELRAYPVRPDDTLGQPIVLHAFAADHRGIHRGIEGMCLDAGGNIVACAGWRRSGPGPHVHVFSPGGAVLESHPLPADLPMKCAFGDADLGTLYVTTGEGRLLRARITGRRGRPQTG
jgi:gluconolactonase